METRYKTIPFDVNRINEEGIKVVTRAGKKARVICTDHVGSGDESLVALINEGTYERVVQLYKSGKFYCNKEDYDDLFMIVPCKYRRMTNQELAWWLRDCPEEHREWKYSGIERHAFAYFDYYDEDKDIQCDDNILIRRNGGAWEEPLIKD